MKETITYSKVQTAKCECIEQEEILDNNYVVRDELEKILASIRRIHEIGANTTCQPLTEISDDMVVCVKNKVLTCLAKTVEIEDTTKAVVNKIHKQVAHLESVLNQGAEALERAVDMRVNGIPKHKHDIEILKAIIGEK